MSDVGDGAGLDFAVEAEDSRSRMAGGELRLGTVATYMLTRYHNPTLITRPTYICYMPTLLAVKLPTAMKLNRFTRLAVRTSD